MIPLAWFLLFGPESISWSPQVGYDGTKWDEVFLARDKEPALHEFLLRLPRLQQLHRPNAVDYSVFVSNLRAFPGSYLILDPQEILGGDGVEDREAEAAFLETFEVLDREHYGALGQPLRRLVGDLTKADDSRLGTSLENFLIGGTYVWPNPPSQRTGFAGR